MKKLFLILAMLLVTTSCSLTTVDEPVIPSESNVVKDNASKGEQVIEEEIFPEDFVCCSYITENCKDLLVIYKNHSFYYQEDCNNQKRIDDWTTWRIGRWNCDDQTMFLYYEDGGEAYATFKPDMVYYTENDETTIFVPSSRIEISVTIDPSFKGSKDIVE